MTDQPGFAETFDTFLEASAEAAIKHVVGAAKGILSTVTIYLVGERSMEYNDEYHYFEGGVFPTTFFLDKESAQAWVRERTLREFTDDASRHSLVGWSSHKCCEIGGDYDNDDMKAFVEQHFPGRDVWDVTYNEVVQACVAEGSDPLDLLPEMFTIQAVSPA